MKNSDKKRLNALEVALTNEQRERAFYLQNAERTGNPVGKAMFEQIADDELEHYQRLKALHETWEKKQTWPETIPLTVKDTKVKDILVTMATDAANMPPGDDDDLQAVRTAIEFEAKGERFYADLRDQVTDPQEKRFFNLLASIEHEHFLSLKETEEFLVDPASWYRMKERHTLDGA